jgi:hypothetical protein
MTDALPSPGSPGAGRSLAATRRLRKAVRRPRAESLFFALLAVLFSTFGVHRLDAHETIDTERANVLVAAADAATASAKTASGPAPVGEAQFALGVVLVEATDALNRDLAAHSGRLALNAALLFKALAQRGLAPRRGDRTLPPAAKAARGSHQTLAPGTLCAARAL